MGAAAARPAKRRRGGGTSADAYRLYAKAEAWEREYPAGAPNGGSFAAGIVAYEHCAEAIRALVSAGGEAVLSREWAPSALSEPAGCSSGRDSDDSDGEAPLPPLGMLLSNALNNSGRLHQRNGDAAAARAAYAAAGNAWPEHRLPAAALNEGSAQRAAGRVARAVELYRVALLQEDEEGDEANEDQEQDQEQEQDL